MELIEIERYKTLFFKKDKIRLKGMQRGYDNLCYRGYEYVLFSNNVNGKMVYYLHSFITGKLILVSEKYEIRLASISFYRKDFLIVKESEKKMYLFQLIYNENSECKNFYLVLDSIEGANIDCGDTIIKFISKYRLIDGYSGLFLTDKNEVYYLDKNICAFKIHTNLKEQFASECEMMETFDVINGHYPVVFRVGKKKFFNLFNINSKKFVFENFLDNYIIDCKQYGENIYIINCRNEILDRDGNVLISRKTNEDLKFHDTLPYVYIKRKDRIGLISLEKRKIILKPIYIEILFDEEEILVLDSVGGSYKEVDIN